MCHEVQRIRAERLSQTKAEVAPILWCDGALARLNPEETLLSRSFTMDIVLLLLDMLVFMNV